MKMEKFSRRDFLKTSGALVVVSTSVRSSMDSAPPPPPDVGTHFDVSLS